MYNTRESNQRISYIELCACYVIGFFDLNTVIIVGDGRSGSRDERLIVCVCVCVCQGRTIDCPFSLHLISSPKDNPINIQPIMNTCL